MALEECKVRIGFTSDPMDASQNWTDVSAKVLSISTLRGRQHALDRFEAGEATIVLRDTDFDFWPANGGGAYSPNVKIGKMLNINRTHNETLYHLYTGFIDSIIPSWVGHPGIAPVVTIHCSDFIKNLSKTRLNDGGGYSQELSGTRIGNVLTNANFPVGNRDIDNGQENMIASGALVNVVAQTHILDVSESEIGLFYMAADGDAQWEDRTHRTNAPHDSALSVFGDDPGEMQYADVRFALDDKFTYNEIRLTRSSGSEQTASDATSQTTYGVRTLTKTGLLLTTDEIVNVYCGFYLARYKDQGNIMRLRSITIKPQNDPDNLWPKVLGYEISSRITVRLNDGSIDDDFFIEGIEHNYDGTLWTTKWNLSDATNYVPTPSALEETLRPNAVGDVTNLSTIVPDSGEEHYEDVDEVTADEDTSYVYEGVGWELDLYGIENPSYTSGTINSVTVYQRSKQNTGGLLINVNELAVKTNGTTYYTVKNNTLSYQNHSVEYTTNPQTSSAWTWNEVTAFQIGTRNGPQLGRNQYTTQMWAVVNYTPTW